MTPQPPHPTTEAGRTSGAPRPPRASYRDGSVGRSRIKRIVGVLGVAFALVAAACTPPTGGGDPRPPIADADTTGSFGPAPFEVSFLSGGSTDPDGSIASYLWDFGDGTTSGVADPTKTYSAEGTYAVTLTVTDDQGLSDTTDPFTVTAHTPGDPAALVVFPELSRSVGLGEDRIAVWTCEVEGAGGVVHDPVDVAAWAQSEADSYYSAVSGGRYQPVFTPVGTFTVASNSDCLDEARSRTGTPYTNVLTVDTTTDWGSEPGAAGRGGPGSVYPNGTGLAPDLPPSESGRGFWINGRAYSVMPDQRTLVHEIGHTLHWPHSFLDPSYEYDNPMDLMSARVGPYSCPGPGWFYQCRPQNTLGFNRWATGWVDPDQVVVHGAGSQQLDLVRPGVDGTQLLVAPATNSSQAVLTVEARPKTGFDDIVDTGGVAVHVFDQRNEVCDLPGSFAGCPSLWRRQGQAWGAPRSYDHVLQPGESHTVHGLTITVDAAITDGYRVTVAGSAKVPVGALEIADAAARFSGVTQRRGGGFRLDLPSGAG